MRTRLWGLRSKILAWSFVPTLFILVAVAVVTFTAYRQVTEKLVIERDRELVRLLANQLAAELTEHTSLLTEYAVLSARLEDTSDTFETATAAQYTMLSQARSRLEVFDAGVLILNNQGTIMAAQPDRPEAVGHNWSNRQYFRQMLRLPEAAFSNITADGLEGADVIAATVPIKGDHGQFLGVIAGMFHVNPTSISPLYDTMVGLRSEEGGKTYLVDGNGRVIYHSDTDRIGDDFSTQAIVQQVLRREVNSLRTRDASGRGIITSFAPVPSTDWGLVTQQDWSDITETIRGYRTLFLGLLVGGSILSISVVFLFTGRIVKPIQALARGAQRIADGDFEHTVISKAGDEIGDLARQFNVMTGFLRKSYADLKERVKELTCLRRVNQDMQALLPPEELCKRIVQHLVPAMQFPESAVPVIELAGSRHTSERYTEGLSHGLHADIGVGENVVGKLFVYYTETKPFLIPEEQNLLDTIGRDLGLWLENAKADEELRNYREHLEQLVEERTADVSAAMEAVNAANRAKSAFLANMSHELRTPLNSIIGFSEVIGDETFGSLTEEQSRYVGHILAAGRHLLDLINDILDLSKVEAGKIELELAPVHVKPLLTNSLVLLREKALKHSLQLDLVVAEDVMDLAIQADERKVKQVLFNLLSNATKFTPDGGSITVEAQREGGEVVISVKDTGIGINKEHLERVFEEFEQIDSSYGRTQQGTGLGLALSKRLVELHGGRIWVESEGEGQGSTFTFTLPLQPLTHEASGEGGKNDA